MPSQQFPFEKGGEKRLKLSWKGMFKNITVEVDGEEIAAYANRKELRTPQRVDLADGSYIEVFSDRQGVHITRNGKALPGAQNDPEVMIKTASGIIYFLGGLNVVLGLVAEINQVDFLLHLGVGYFTAGFGAILLVLGYFTRKRVVGALILAIALIIIDMALSLYVQMENMPAGASPRYTGVIVKIFFLLPMFKAIKPMKEMNAKAAKEDEDVIDTEM